MADVTGLSIRSITELVSNQPYVGTESHRNKS